MRRATGIGFAILFLLLVSASFSFGAHTVTAWPENKNGAVSLTFDDGCQSHISLGVPTLNARGLKGTFFVTIDGVLDGYSPPWNSWRNAANGGHEIGSHTISHPDLSSLPLSQVDYELAGSRAQIDAQITTQKTISLAYPYGDSNASVVSIARNYYIFARGISCGLNSDPYDFYNLKACSPDVGDDIYAQADAAELQRKLLVVYIHSLDGGSDCWGSWVIDMWTTYLDYLKRKNLWIGPVGAAVKYIKERGSSTISVLSSSSDQIVLSLTDTLDDTIYNQPLTIRSEVPSGWTTVRIQQGGSDVALPSALEGSTRVVYYNVVPDGGFITLRNPLAATPQIASLTPQFASVGGSAFTLAVNGGNFVSGSKVRWNGSDRVTTFLSATQLRANILAADVATAGTVPVTVFNPDGTLSNAVTIEVRSPQPFITNISPSWGTAGSPSFALTVDGSNFISGSKVRWKGSDRTTTFVSVTELLASIPAADIASAGSAGVTVYTPSPGGGTSNTVNFDVYPVLSSVTVSPSAVAGGTSSTGTVTLSGPAPLGGAVVSLSSDNTSAATVPTSVTVAAGAASATFTIATVPVSSATIARISGLFGGVTRSSNLTVTLPSLSSLSMNPSTVQGGNSSTGTVTLSGPAPTGGAVVSLSNSNTSAATVPASVTVAGGATSATFAVTTSPVSGSTVVTITATYKGVNRTSVLTVTPPPPTVNALAVSPSAVAGGTSSTGTVTLSGPAPLGGAVVSLSSDNTSAATVPASVTVAAGAASATFTIATVPVSSATVARISGLYGGVTRSSNLTVNPPSLSSLSLNPSTVQGGNSSTGTVTLAGPAPTGGAVVSLSSDNTSTAAVPSSVTVEGGASSATFAVMTSPVSGSTVVTISALYGGLTRTAILTVTAPPAVTVLSPSSATAGGPAFTLSVSGSNFVSGSKVRWNGSDRVTTFGSATQLQASILAADLAATGMIPVTVLNPDGGLSNAMTFEVLADLSSHTDNFNRANESPIQGNWAAWDFGLGRMEVYNNQLRSTDTNRYNVWARRTSEPYSSNHYSQIKLTSIPTGEVGGPAVRVQLNGSEINGYIFTVLNSTTAAIWVRYSTGIWQQVGTNFTGTFASGDVYRLAINGNVLTVNRNGVTLGTRTDANNRVPTGGAAGVTVVYPGTFDDWQGGDTSVTISPAISSISPTFMTAGGPAFTLTVTGSNFVSGSKVRWNGSDRVTTFVSATQLRATVLAADVATAGTVPVTVFNPDGSLSNTMSFEVRSPQPTITDISPSWGTAGGPSFTLVVDGSNFISGSKVRWKGSDRTTTFVSGTELQASISAADIASAGTAGVTVYTPAPGGGTSNAINFDILPVLSSVTVNPATVVGGASSTGTVRLSGPAPAGGALVSLSSNNSPVASVPASVTVAAGASSATFTITTSAVSGSTAVTISGLYGGVTRSASLAVLPVNIPLLTSLSLNPSSVMGGNGSTGTVTMSGPAPVGGADVTLSSNNPSVVSVPSTVTLAGGATNATFPITTISVSSSTAVNVSAVYAGITKTSVLTVNPSSLSSLSLSPSAIVGGNTSRGTVTLNGPAPSGGAVVSLASNNTSAATVPTSVTVASGNASATFTIATAVVSSSRAVSISSLYGGVTRSATLTVLPENSPSAGHGITPWPENKSGAVSLTFDDGDTSQYTLGVPALNARGLKASFYIITEYGGVPLDTTAWNSWRNSAVTGHEIGSHTKTHPDLTQLSPAQLQDEVVGSKSTIDAQITTQKTLTFVYPSGYFNSSVMSIVQDNYIAARGVNCNLNDEPFDFYNVSACTPDDVTLDIYAWTDAAEQQKKWLVLYFHSLLGAIENGWGSYEIGMFTTYLDYLQQKNLWVGTFGSAVKYLKERSSATLSVYSSSSDQMVLSLSDSLDDAVYNQPLTLRSEVPSGWASVKIEQGSSSIEVPSTVEGTTRVVYYNALPDRGLITLRNPQAGTPQITALAPQFVTTGGPALTLTVTGSNFVSGSKVRWNGSDRVTTFVSATQLRAIVLAADVATAGTVPVTVFNPDGSISNAMTFEIRSPQPDVIHLTPSWGTAGGPSFTLIVDGSNFVSGSKVRWKGSDRTTTFVSGTELQASISAADIASAGTAGVTVYTPPPGGGTSNAIDFDILPVLSSVTVNPSSVQGGSPSTGTVTLSGPAPAGGALVSLSSDNTSAATVPASVTVAAGASSATFAVTTSAVSGSTAVTISALYGGVTRTAPLTVTPLAALSSLQVNPSSVQGGSPSTGTVTLSGPAPSVGRWCR